MRLSFLVTGGCGFIGSNLAVRLREEHTDSRVIAFDNLKRRGSELNIPRLKEAGVEFVHGDVRELRDLEVGGSLDFLIDCSAEPAVSAGAGGSPLYIIEVNLMGTANCLEIARRQNAAFIFLSTSRVYPKEQIDSLAYVETDTRYQLDEQQTIEGVSHLGIAESFPLEGARTLYGASKLASELLATEYSDMFGVKVVMNRCGTIAGPWQMGKVDQGFVALWVARHLWGDAVDYLGYGGSGKQVRDVLHIGDLCDLIIAQIERIDSVSGEVFNVGGGISNSASLMELTTLCEQNLSRKVSKQRREETSSTDIRFYVTDITKVTEHFDWYPRRNLGTVVSDIADWLKQHEDSTKPLLMGNQAEGTS